MKGQENYVPGRKRPTGLLFPWCKSAVPGGAVGGGWRGGDGWGRLNPSCLCGEMEGMKAIRLGCCQASDLVDSPMFGVLNGDMSQCPVASSGTSHKLRTNPP